MRMNVKSLQDCRCLLVSTFLFSAIACIPHHAVATTYYVNAASGSDTNPGTAAQPWKSFYKAAKTIASGDTAIFKDGTYNETQRGVILNSNTTFRAENSHGAKLVYQGLQNTWGKVYTERSNVTIQGFEITENAKGNNGNDVLVHFGLANLTDPATSGNKFIDNIVHGAYFNCLKVYKSDNFLADGNILYDTDGLAFVSTNNFGTVFRNNYIYDVTGADPAAGTTLQFKGGVRSAQIYNNVLRVRTGHTIKGALVVGGQSSANAAFDTTANTSYEAYNCVAYNNVIVAEDIGSMQYGIIMSGARDSALYNNIVIGADYAIYLMKASGDIASGWGWEPKTKNPKIKNNMIVNSKNNSGSHTATYLGGVNDIEGTVDHDYNLFYNASGANTLPPVEPHGVYADPRFVGTLTDWHLHEGSPALLAGTVNTFTGYLGETIDVSKDMYGYQRVAPWDIGIYASTGGTQLAGYWKFNETTGTSAADSSGNGNTGSLLNSPTWTTGKLANALSFDGVDDYVQVNDSPSLHPGTKLTVAAWVNLSGHRSGNYIAQKIDSTGHNGWLLQTDASGHIQVRITNATPDSTGEYRYTSTNTVATGGWHHIAFAYSAPNALSVYLDGTLIFSGPPSITMTATTTRLYIGTTSWGVSQNTSSYKFWGKIDDVRVYNRYLSAGEILRLYNNTI